MKQFKKLAAVLAFALTLAVAMPCANVVTAQAAKTVTANPNYKKAPVIKKTGTVNVKAPKNHSMIAFRAPKAGTYKFTISNIATMGSVDLTGRKNGFVNIDKNKYVDSVIGVAKEKSTPAVSQTDLETDGLLQYVADLRTRKSRRNRASTVNTDGSASNNLNKLGGTTALGV